MQSIYVADLIIFFFLLHTFLLIFIESSPPYVCKFKSKFFFVFPFVGNKIADLFVENGANPNEKNSNGESPYDLSLKSTNSNIRTLLRKAVDKFATKLASSKSRRVSLPAFNSSATSSTEDSSQLEEKSGWDVVISCPSGLF